MAGKAKSATGDASGSAKGLGGDLASKAKSASGDVKGAAKSAGRQIDQATPDLSANPFDDLAGKVDSPEPCHRASIMPVGSRRALVLTVSALAQSSAAVQGCVFELLLISGCCMQVQSAAGDVAGQAKSAGGDASGSAKDVGGDIASKAKSATGDVKGAAKSAGRQIDQVTPDLSANPFDDLAGKVRLATPIVAVFHYPA